MSQVDPATSSRPSIPKGLDSPRGKLVYLYLDRVGEASLDEIASALDLPLIDLCGLARTLESREVITRDGDRYRPIP